MASDLYNLRLDFRSGGNARSCLVNGWSSQEDDKIWAIGALSTIMIPGCRGNHDLELCLEIMPYIPEGPSSRKRLNVVVCGQTVRTFLVQIGRTTVNCRIAAHLVGDKDALEIRFEHPEPHRPCDFGGQDTRPLAFAFFSLSLTAVSLGTGQLSQTSDELVEPPALAGHKEDLVGPKSSEMNVNSSIDTLTSAPKQGAKVAVITFVFNEIINLPIWVRYYGEQFGRNNLFVIDRESSDGSTSALGEVNRIVIPRDAFDDQKKAEFMSSMQNALLNYYDVVVCTDCDEILVPDLQKFCDLRDYINKSPLEYVTSIGLNLRHIIHYEPPLDLSLPVLAQRRYATFQSATCKTLISRVPIRWLAGFHCLDRRPVVDKHLFLFHTKGMDYNIASARYKVNFETIWSESALALRHGEHHRFEYVRVMRELFINPCKFFDDKKFVGFDFGNEIAAFESRIAERNGYYWIPMDIVRHVEIPEYFRGAF